MCLPRCTGHHLHCLQMWVTLIALVGFQTKWLCWAMLLSQDKETRVQWPSLTPWRSCPRRLPAEYCWGSVRSAALCLAGGKQMDKLHTRAYTVYSCITVFRKTWPLLSNHFNFKATLNFILYLNLKLTIAMPFSRMTSPKPLWTIERVQHGKYTHSPIHTQPQTNH